MGLFFWKKNKKKAKLTEEEIDQLKEQLDEKMGEFKTLYHDLVEAGGSELPEDILDSVSGGFPPVTITTPDSTNGLSGQSWWVEIQKQEAQKHADRDKDGGIEGIDS